MRGEQEEETVAKLSLVETKWTWVIFRFRDFWVAERLVAWGLAVIQMSL